MDRGERTKKIASISLELQMNMLTAICVGMFVPVVYFHLYAAELLDVSHFIRPFGRGEVELQPGFDNQ